MKVIEFVDEIGRGVGSLRGEVPEAGTVVELTRGKFAVLDAVPTMTMQPFPPYGAFEVFRVPVRAVPVEQKPVEVKIAPPLTTWTELSVKDFRRSGKGLCGGCAKPHGRTADQPLVPHVNASPLCHGCALELAPELARMVGGFYGTGVAA